MSKSGAVVCVEVFAMNLWDIYGGTFNHCHERNITELFWYHLVNDYSVKIQDRAINMRDRYTRSSCVSIR